MRQLLVALTTVLTLLFTALPGAEDSQTTGRAVEVIGDLAGATRIAILVPGADTTLETFHARGDKPYSTPGGGARALRAEALDLDPRADLAAIAWLDYDTPRTLSLEVLSDRRAIEGAKELRRLVTTLHGTNGAGISLLCHSYGSRVCAEAAQGLPVTDLVVYGSLGMGVSTVAELQTGARVWAGLGAGDWVRYLPGAQPVSPRFGARVFAAGDGGHSDYLAPGSLSLRNLALIALGRSDDVR